MTVAVAVLAGAGAGWAAGGLLAETASVAGAAAAALALLVALWVVVVLGRAALAWKRRRTLVVDGSDVENATGGPLLAHVSAPTALTTLPALDPGTPGAAALESLRRAVERRIGLPRPLTVLVTGPGDDEVPVWVGANLAILLARRARRVLLVDARIAVDADASVPGVSGVPGVPGLAGLLGGTAIGEAVLAGPVAGMDALPPGSSADLAALGLCAERRVPSREGAGAVGRGGSDALDALDVLACGLMPRLGTHASDYEVVVVVGPPLPVPVPAVSRVPAVPTVLQTGARSAARPATASGRDRTEPAPRAGVVVLTMPEAGLQAATVGDAVDAVADHGARLLGTVLVAPVGAGDR